MGKVKGRIQELEDMMEFDHVIRVHEDGTISEPGGFWAPEFYDSRCFDKSWTMLTGYTGQYLYSGPVMHDSEYIGGGLAEDILDTPGVYVAVTHTYTAECEHPTECECEDVQEGWGIAFQEWHTPGHEPGTLYGCLECETECFCGGLAEGQLLHHGEPVKCVHCAE